MALACNGNEACDTADCARKADGADGNLVHIYRRIPCGALARADNGYLIAVLCSLEVEIHEDDHYHYDYHIKQILPAEYSREPADIGIGIDDIDAVGALGVFPERNEI